MGLLFRLLLNPKTARAFYYWMMGIWSSRCLLASSTRTNFKDGRSSPQEQWWPLNDAGMAPW